MGLEMKTKRKLANEASKRYQEKTKILDGFVKTAGYNRKYALHVLKNGGKACIVSLEGKAVRLKAKTPDKRKGRSPRFKYGPEVIAVIAKIGEFFDYQCGQLLVPLMRLAIGVLAADKTFGINEEIKTKLLPISSSAVNRRLKFARKKLELKGKSLAKPGKLLKNQIPVRTFFSWDGRKPGFFEMGTASHCGVNSSGEFCGTLTLVDAASGWALVFSLRNRAHARVKSAIAEVYRTLPFPLLGLGSDNGGEFINMRVKQWRGEHGVQFTRSRPCRKNDNCFVERKNGDIARKTVGYYRYDTDEETAALASVYRYLCSLVNFRHPSIKITGKERLQNGKLKKFYDTPKTPCQRILEPPDVSPQTKDLLRRQAALTNPVQLKKLQNTALARLLVINREKF